MCASLLLACCSEPEQVVEAPTPFSTPAIVESVEESSCELFAQANAQWTVGELPADGFKTALDGVAAAANAEGEVAIQRDAETMADRMRPEYPQEAQFDAAHARLMEACATELDAP